MNKHQRKSIEIDRKRIPLKKLLHGKEIRDAAKALEEYRLHLNETEFLYGATIKIHMNDYSEAYIVASRLENDREFAERLERIRVAAEEKAAREAKRKLAAEQRAIREKEQQKQRAIETLLSMAKANGLTSKDLESLLDNAG